MLITRQEKNKRQKGCGIPRIAAGQKAFAKFTTLSADPYSGSRETNPTLRGVVIAVNEAHRHVTVEAGVSGGAIRESFKTWEVWG